MGRWLCINILSQTHLTGHFKSDAAVLTVGRTAEDDRTTVEIYCNHSTVILDIYIRSLLYCFMFCIDIQLYQ